MRKIAPPLNSLPTERKRVFLGASDFPNKVLNGIKILMIPIAANKLKAGAKIIGINNRDLDTLHVNLETTRELARHIPDDKIVISESGFTSTAEIEKLSSCGINAVLVGTEIMKSDNMATKIKEMSNVGFR